MFFLRDKRKELTSEIARLEAFLSAMPCAYCGWSSKGEIAYSNSFKTLLEIDEITDPYDIYNTLITGDAAALEGLFTALRNKGEDFCFQARTKDKKKVIQFTGKRGRNLAENTSYDVLTAENVTSLASEKSDLYDAKEISEQEEERLKTILDTLPIFIWNVDSLGEMTWANRYYAEQLETTRERLIKEQQFLNTTHVKEQKNHFQDIKKQIAKTIEEKQATKSIYHSVLKGKRRLVKVIITPNLTKNTYICAAIDITEQEDIYMSFKEFRENTHALLGQLQSAIASFDEETHLDFYNTKFSKLWDLEESWLNKRPTLNEIMEKLRTMRRLPEQADFKGFKQSWLSMFIDLLETQEDFLYLPDGSTLRMLSIPRPSGGLIMTFEDVTSSLELESSYNTLMAVQKESLDSLVEAVAVFGGDGRLKLHNKAYAKIWDIDPENLDGEPHITKLVERKKKHFEKSKWPDIKIMLSNYALERTDREERLELKDGRILSVYAAPLPDGGIMVSYDDITAMEQVQSALIEKNAALEQAEQVKLDFLANVSYQLRTPLNAIMGFAEILSNKYFGEINDKQMEYTTSISDAGNRLLTLIDDILDLSTIEAGYLELSVDRVDVKAMLEHIFGLTEEWARKENLTATLKCPKTVGQVMADERRLKQVILNLIRNAITFTDEGGKIIIEGKKTKDGFVEVSVSDTGDGIPEEELKTIFDPFDQGSNGRAKNEGVGLGLSLVKNIMELHEGDVRIDSKVNKGTTVSVLIPIKQSEEQLKEAS